MPAKQQPVLARAGSACRNTIEGAVRCGIAGTVLLQAPGDFGALRGIMFRPEPFQPDEQEAQKADEAGEPNKGLEQRAAGPRASLCNHPSIALLRQC